MGTAVLYPMALLRVADYLQIDRQRAPAVLLQLRSPKVPSRCGNGTSTSRSATSAPRMTLAAR